MICIDVGTDILPSISLSYEIAEIDIMTRKPRGKYEHLVSIKALVHAYALMGLIAVGGGFSAYFVTFNQLGFPIQSLFGMATWKGYHKPPIGDFTDDSGCESCINSNCAYFNSNFMSRSSENCSEDIIGKTLE